MSLENKKIEYAIRMNKITKTFLGGKVIANENVDLKVKPNEVHALIGENGAGKSTLMSILFGIYTQDSGKIYINDEEVIFTSAKDAAKHGIGMVHQHFKLVDEFSIWENVILGDEQTSLLAPINIIEIKKTLQSLVDKYNFNLNINQKVSKLTVGQQQKTEILKLLYRNAEILIFDEPTAVLSDDEIQSFLEMLIDFKKKGKTIIIITHKLNEIKQVADRGTVIRRGRYIEDFDISSKSISEISTSMVGKKIENVKNDSIFDYKKSKTIFEIKDLNLYSIWKKKQEKGDFIADLVEKIKNKDFSVKTKSEEVDSQNSLLNLELRAGEIHAIAGVEGNGQSELALIIAGLMSANHSSKIFLHKDDKSININKQTIAKRFDLGISNVPEDRHKHGLVLDWPIAMNAISQSINKSPYSKFGFVNSGAIYKYATKLIKEYDVRGTTRGTTISRLLSGGNQQKLILGRELDREHDVIVLVQPTRGMDLGAISFIHQQILEEKNKGKAVLLISYELDEVIGLADTISVMQNGKIIETNTRQKMTRQYIGELMAAGE